MYTRPNSDISSRSFGQKQLLYVFISLPSVSGSSLQLIILHTAQFGPCSFGPQHGFARITRWTLERAPERLHNGDVEAIFSLMDNEFTRSMWHYP